MTHKEKINESGEMHIVTSWGIICYDIFTKASFFRGGKIYFADKKYIILSWRCELTQEINGKDMLQSIDSQKWIFEIKSGTPHIFYGSRVVV